MIEKLYSYTKADAKVIEKLVGDDLVMINHVILAQDDALPEHYSDSNVYLIVAKGRLSIQLGDEPLAQYTDTIVNIPYHTKMNISNKDAGLLEFFIVKAPHPRMYKAE